MNAKVIVSALSITLLGSIVVLAQDKSAAPKAPMSFFVAPTPNGSGNLGGLAGADQLCQNLAQSAGAGNHAWHAYLSTQTTPQAPGVNARGRIGTGPWYNAKGVRIAGNIGDLHGTDQRDPDSLQPAKFLDEKGKPIQGAGAGLGEHDILTGSDSDGRSFPAGLDTTCNNWTSDGTDHKAILGHADRGGGGNTSWNSVHLSTNCTKTGLVSSGADHILCFASDPPAPGPNLSPPADTPRLLPSICTDFPDFPGCPRAQPK